MDIKELLATAKNFSSYELKQKLNNLVRSNYKYSNLNEKNRQLILDLIAKHLDQIRDGQGISSTIIQAESYRLYENRIKLGLTEEDLKDIKEILNLFKK